MQQRFVAAAIAVIGVAASGATQAHAVGLTAGAQHPLRCTNAQLDVTSRHIGAAMSHAGLQAIFTNESKRACTLSGYPGVAAVNSHGKQFEQARRTTNGYLAGRDNGRPRTIIIRPGGRASAVIEGTSVGGKHCQAGRAFLVTPPNTRRATRLGFRNYFCNLQVHRVISGVQR